MRIGFDAKRAFNNYSGLGNYSRNVIKHLAGTYPENEFYLYNPVSGDRIADFPPDNTKLKVPQKSSHILLPSVWRSFFLPDILNKDGIDIYHGLSNELPFGSQKFKGKTVVTIHDLIFLRFPHLYKFADRRIYTKKFSYSARCADRIVAISEQTKSDIVEFFDTDPCKIEVIYQDCAPDFYNQSLGENEKQRIKEDYDLPENYILYVGTIEERKNLLSIVKAMHVYNIGLPLVVAGKSTKYKDKVVNYITENSLSNISFIERVAQKDLPEIYSKASMLVYPSSFEGFGIPVLEALNTGTPVITSKGSCLQETGGDAAYYVDPLDIEDLGTAIQKVFEDSELRRNMITRGRKHALKFRPEITTRILFELYESLV